MREPVTTTVFSWVVSSEFWAVSCANAAPEKPRVAMAPTERATRTADDSLLVFNFTILSPVKVLWGNKPRPQNRNSPIQRVATMLRGGAGLCCGPEHWLSRSTTVSFITYILRIVNSNFSEICRTNSAGQSPRQADYRVTARFAGAERRDAADP